MDYHRMLKRSNRRYGFHFLPGKFVSFKDRFLVPVGPVYIIFEGCNTEGMPEIIRRVENRSSTGTIIIAGTYDVQLCIYPIHSLAD